MPAFSELDLRPTDGRSTHSAHPEWGASGTDLLQLSLIDHGPNGEMSGADRPNARLISNLIASQTNDTENAAGASDFLWIWGQFLDHDMSLTEAGETVSADIPVPLGDPFFDPSGTGSVVIPFHRVDLQDGAYVNQITAYIDASMIYGSDAETLARMRVDGGKLLMTEDALLDHDGAKLETGDSRAAENVALSSMHTIFTREHNRLVSEMAAEDPTMTEDQLFNAARAQLEAMIQAITFNDFLPILIGEDAIGAYQGYDADVNPGITTEFSTAVFRLGHTLLSSNLQLVAEDGSVATPLALRNAFFRPTLLSEEGMIDNLMRGAAGQAAQALDTQIVEDVRSFLFGLPGAGGFDLASLNIQRGRDLGVASYNDLREALGLARAETFADITSDSDLRARLETAYGDTDLVDAWVGGLAEDAFGDGLLGETFTVVLVDQFTRLRDGDPLWSEVRAGIPENERKALWNTTLSDIILRNTDVQAIQDDVFIAMTRQTGTDQDDQILGSGDRDFIFGGAGLDHLSGKAGQDDLQGGNGHDLLKGNRGDDRLDGGQGRDELFGGLGDDFLFGRAGKDQLAGGRGDDVLRGNRGDDFLYGKSGDDILAAGFGDDALKGGSGADRLFGGAGNDTLRGGFGADIFVFSQGHDQVGDFTAGDRIDLSKVAAITGFADLRANHMSGVAGTVIEDGMGNTLTLTNVGSASLHADDFVF